MMKSQWIPVSICLAVVPVMMRFAVAQEAEPERLQATHRARGSTREAVARTLCYAGRFKVGDRGDRGASRRARGSFIEQVASEPNHPNAEVRKDGHFVEEGVGDPILEVGRIYCLIIAPAWGKTGAAIVAWAEDTPEALAAIKQIMQSPQAFENSEEWQKRRRLWKGFWRDLSPDSKITVYCEDEGLSHVVYGLEENGVLHLRSYNHADGKHGDLLFQKGSVGRFNRITYKDGGFIVWNCGRVELKLGA